MQNVAPFDIATCMYYTWIDPFTKKEVNIAKGMRDRKMQRALMQFFKPENWFTVREALIQPGRSRSDRQRLRLPDPRQSAKEALEATADRRMKPYEAIITTPWRILRKGRSPVSVERDNRRQRATGQVERASPGVRSPVAAETDHWGVKPRFLLDGTGPLKARLLWKSKEAEFVWEEFSRSANTQSSKPPLRTQSSIPSTANNCTWRPRMACPTRKPIRFCAAFVERAKRDNVPSHVIEKAIQKAAGTGGEDFQSGAL